MENSLWDGHPFILSSFALARQFHSDRVGTVAPVDISTLKVGDIVLCKVGGSEFLHIIKAIGRHRFQIGNNRGRINGWVGPNGIFGKCVRIRD